MLLFNIVHEKDVSERNVRLERIRHINVLKFSLIVFLFLLMSLPRTPYDEQCR